jgi:hypothetical protein
MLKGREMTTTNDFIKSIAQESGGFSFGQPWRYSEHGLAAILPILREAEGREYLTLSESTDVRVEDTGSINAVVATNSGEKPVLVRPGELFKGKTQERTAVVGRVVLPGEKVRIDVVCVHRSRPITSGAETKTGGVAPSSVLREVYSSSNQGMVWQAVSDYSTRLSIRTSGASDYGTAIAKGPTDDLVAQMDSHARVIADIIKAMPLHDHQVGMALLTLDGLRAVECFDFEDSWKATREDIALKEGEDLEQEDKTSAWEFKPDKGAEIVGDALGVEFLEESLITHEEHSTVKLSSDQFLGQAVILKGKVIYLSLLRKENTP